MCRLAGFAFSAAAMATLLLSVAHDVKMTSIEDRLVRPPARAPPGSRQRQILREVYPERQGEILRFAQNDSEWAQDDSEGAKDDSEGAQDDSLGGAALDGLPHSAVRYGIMASNTSGRIGVVALWSR